MTTDAHRLIQFCSVCHDKTELLCQRCREPYCSKICQVFDWSNHKFVCMPMPVLVKASDFGIADFPAVDIFPTRRPGQRDVPLIKTRAATGVGVNVAPLRKPKAATDVGVNVNADVVPAKTFQQNSSNFPLKTNSKTTFPNKAVEVKTNESTKATCVVRNPESFVRTIYNDQSEAIKNASSNFKTSQQSEPHMLKREMTKIGDSTWISPEIRATTIPKPIEMKAAPKPQKMIVTPQLEMKKPPNSSEIQQTIPKPVEMGVAPKPIKVEASQKPLEMEEPPKQLISSVSSTLTEAWMTTFPIEETGFVCVVVQFTPMKCSQTAWVMLKKNEAASINLLREVNKNISAAPNVKREEVKVNQLYRVPFEDIYYRGVTLKPVTSDGLILVRLIDYGNELNVPIDTVKASIPMMNKLHAFGFQIKFQTPREVAIEDVLKIQVKSIRDKYIMNVIVEGEVAYTTKDDLETVPIPIGTKTKLYCLDYSNIKKGYIAACVYDSKAIGRIEAIGSKISEYCVRSKDSYNPQLNELCLALYEDGEWYRAVVDKIIDADIFGIVFVDYGNTAVVKSLNIRKMPDEFMHHCLMNKCYIKGAPERPTHANIEKMILYFHENQVFTIESATKENDVYKIQVAELPW